MRKNIGLVFSVVLCFLIASALLQNYRAQQASQQRISDLEKQVENQKSVNGAAAPTAAPVTVAPSPVTTDATADKSPSSSIIMERSDSLPTEYARKQQQILEVMNQGWKLINVRKAESAANAAELFQAALDKIDDKSPDLYNGLGRALLIAGKPKEAIGAWRRGLAIQPKMAEMQSGIGWAYWHLQDPYHAKAAWDAALVVDPKCADAWSAVAWIDLALGQNDVAKRGFQALYEHDQKNNQWIMGLAMAQARNTDITQIRQFFPVPDVAAFSKPPATDPAADVAVNMVRQAGLEPQS